MNKITEAFLLAAGLGIRLRPLFLSFRAKSRNLSFFC
jgi:dTDP-glucose pyrophosphorylase